MAVMNIQAYIYKFEMYEAITDNVEEQIDKAIISWIILTYFFQKQVKLNC